jgi:hypothetical protein
MMRTKNISRNKFSLKKKIRENRSPVNWGCHLFGANPGEQNQTENVTRICFTYLGHCAI